MAKKQRSKAGKFDDFDDEQFIAEARRRNANSIRNHHSGRWLGESLDRLEELLEVNAEMLERLEELEA